MWKPKKPKKWETKKWKKLKRKGAEGNSPYLTPDDWNDPPPFCPKLPESCVLWRTPQIKCNDKCTPSNWKGISLINYDAAAAAEQRKGWWQHVSSQGGMVVPSGNGNGNGKGFWVDVSYRNGLREAGGQRQPTVDFNCNAHLNNNSAVGRNMAAFCFPHLLLFLFFPRYFNAFYIYIFFWSSTTINVIGWAESACANCLPRVNSFMIQ